jgi:hypothetical protein
VLQLKKRRYKIAKRIALILLPLLLVAGGWVYFKLYGFKRALEDLVDSQTQGQYVLVINKSSVNFSALTFSFEKLSIQRNDTVQAKGIRAVNIPSMHVRFGSLPSMFALEKFRIKALTMDEPEIVIDVPAKRETSTRVDLTQQIVKLYPAVESLLSHFDIESLSIRRATIELNRPNDQLVRLRLVDLLVKDWDIKALTQDSQLKLNISGQGLDFGKAGLSFSEIEYNFQQRHLFFTDFSFTSIDTVSDSRVEVTGKSLRLQHLDYKDLYENQRYVLRRADVDQPRVTARFKLAKFKRNKNEEGDMFTRIIKQAIGECHIDSTVIRNAQVHLVIHREKDSLKIDLPRVDFRLHTFKVSRDSSAFSIGELGVNLNRTAISLRNNLLLSFREILFDRHQNLTIIDAALVDSALHKKIATIGKLRLEYFDLLRLVLDKELYAQRVDIENADLNISPTRVSQNRVFNHGLGDIVIRDVTLKNTTVHYRDAGKQIDLKGLSVGMTHLHYDTVNKPSYSLKDVKAQTVFISDKSARIDSRLKDVAFDGRQIRAAEIDLTRDSLHLIAKSVTGEMPPGYFLGDFDHWKSIRCASINIQGPLPTIPDKPDRRVTIDEIKVDQLVAYLHHADTRVSFSGKDMLALGVVNGGQMPKSLRGELSDLHIATPRQNIAVAVALLDYPSVIRCRDVDISGNSTQIKSQTMIIRSLKKASSWQIGKITATRVSTSRQQEPILQSDSVRIVQIVLGASPAIGAMEIFHPRITLSKNKIAFQEHMNLPLPEQLTLHPGELQLKNGNQLQFGRVELDTDQGLVRCMYLHTSLGKRPVEMSGLLLDGDQLTVDSVRIHESTQRGPSPFEDDRIDARLYGVQVEGISIDAGAQSATLKDLDIGLERFTLDIRRDKRLPDPPMMEKPFTLERFFNLPEDIHISKVRLKDGTLRYGEITEQNGDEAVVNLDNIAAILEFNSATSRLTMNAKTRLYGSGTVDVRYQTLDDHSFRLNVKVRDFDLTRLNPLVVPMQSVRVKSGFLLAYDLDVVAGEDKATGEAAITYRDLHLELLKRNDPDRRGLRMELINLVADGIILRNRREAAVADVSRMRIHHKSVFNYWVKTVFHGALATVKNGKRARK